VSAVDLLRADLQLVISLVPEGSRVLDLGCGDGSLMAHLRDERGCEVRGIELAPEEIAAALGRGLSVVQADLDAGLAGYPDGAFDVVVLSQTIQVMRNPALVLREMLRVGERGIVTFPNFGHWRVRGYLALKGDVTPGTLVAAVGYIWMIMMPLRNLSNTINIITQAISSGDRLFYYLDFGSEIKERPDAVFPEEFKGHVRFENVTFRYEDEPVLRNITFDVQPGHTLAIMGATGSGKTSIVNLLARFYECGEGAVKIDGIDVKDYKLRQLRRQIGYVMQETFLFSETLENNIAFGWPDATQEELDEAAAAACAAEYIDKLDEGYATIVGERGLGLSGGQKQRAAIARALCYGPKILVLDDATSSVDMETEYAIQQALKMDSATRTTFIISHRISAVKDADEIIVLETGAIAERGTHGELLKKHGLYYGIFMDQYRDYEAISGERLVVS